MSKTSRHFSSEKSTLIHPNSLMIQGTTSDAGKSILVAGICRVLRRNKISVAPFKPQNMALNSAVTRCGGEIGRAQALQAFACGLEPEIDFNPVLLKPSSDKKSQVILNGKVVNDLDARSFGNIKDLAFESVLAAYRRLTQQYDAVIIEGAGSPAEINLRKNDIANMGFAEAVDCPVVLVSDIDRGGVFAHIVGTLELLSQSERDRTQGFVINKFRGELALLQSGLDWLEGKTSKPVIGVLPMLSSLKLDSEDAIDSQQTHGSNLIKIKVPVLKRISNHTDFDPLRWHPNVDLEFIGEGDSLQGADIILLPGSKNVRDDLAFLIENHWDSDIRRHLRFGGKVFGICGGFQMLGRSIHDPLGVESHPGSSKGLGFIEMDTHLTTEKKLTQVSGVITCFGSPSFISGYEIHCGESSIDESTQSFSSLTDQFEHSFVDGACNEDLSVVGTYVHGLFEKKESLEAFLNWGCGRRFNTTDWNTQRDQELNRLADCIESHLSIKQLENIIFNRN